MSETKALVRIDPQALLTRAVEGNASIETLERLVALAKDVREVQAREAWHEAMAAFQRQCPPITKTKTANIETARGSYSYHYAPLDAIMEIIRPLLGELGLSVSWTSRVEPQRVIVACRVAHVLGYSENSGEISMPIPDSSERGGGNPAQRVGSALTYARRYSLLSIVGLAPEDDDDAQVTHADTTQDVHHQEERPASRPAVFPFGKHKDAAPSTLSLSDLQREESFWIKKVAEETNPRYKENNQRLLDAIRAAITEKSPPAPASSPEPVGAADPPSPAASPAAEASPSPWDLRFPEIEALMADKGKSQADVTQFVRETLKYKGSRDDMPADAVAAVIRWLGAM